MNTIHHLGFSVHPEKCNFIPLRSQEFLGAQVNLKTMQFRVPGEKLRNTRREVQSVFALNDQHLLMARDLASLPGELNTQRARSYGRISSDACGRSII